MEKIVEFRFKSFRIVFVYTIYFTTNNLAQLKTELLDYPKRLRRVFVPITIEISLFEY